MDKDTVRVIDCHTHAWMAEDFKALAELGALLDVDLPEKSPYNWTPRFEGTVRALVEEERAAGVDRFVLLPVSGRPERCRELTVWAARAGEEFPEVIPFGAIHPDTATPRDDAALVLDHGLSAVKIHSLVQRFDCQSVSSMRLYEALEKAGLPVLMDSMLLAGAVAVKPNLGPWMNIASVAGFETTPDKIAQIARRFPGLRILAAHMGCCYGWHLLDGLYDLDNVWFDMSYIHRLMSPEQAVSIIRAKGADRIVWGTDAPYRRPKNALDWFHGLPLDDGEKENILAGNLIRFLGL